jgi:hypothetical protein
MKEISEAPVLATGVTTTNVVGTISLHGSRYAVDIPKGTACRRVQIFEPTEEGWEVKFYNSYGNYTHYRFQDFKGVCPMRGGEYGECDHPEHDCASADDRPCECSLCPCVNEAADEDDEIDYCEGEQPIIVSEWPAPWVVANPDSLTEDGTLDRIAALRSGIRVPTLAIVASK